jgi:hypothetical protein
MTLTPRDIGILTLVHSYCGCTADHIRRRFFATAGARSACYERIALLVDTGYLTRLRLPSQSGQGSGKFFFTVGRLGRPVMTKILGLTRAELSRASRASSPLFISHHLALCDARLSLELAVLESSLFTLSDWTGDAELKYTPLRIDDPTTRRITVIVPDACFTLTLADGSEQPFLLEMDLATVAPKRMKEKLRGYLSRPSNSTCPVLFVVPSRARQRSIVQWAQEAAQAVSADSTIFWVTTQDRLSEHTFLTGPIWQIVGGPDNLAFSDIVAADGQTRRALHVHQAEMVAVRQSLEHQHSSTSSGHPVHSPAGVTSS